MVFVPFVGGAYTYVATPAPLSQHRQVQGAIHHVLSLPRGQPQGGQSMNKHLFFHNKYCPISNELFAFYLE